MDVGLLLEDGLLFLIWLPQMKAIFASMNDRMGGGGQW